MKQVILLKVFIGSPGDVLEQRNEVEKTILEGTVRIPILPI